MVYPFVTVFLSGKHIALGWGGGAKDSQEVIMGPATILPANGEIGNTKHYEKIHLTYRVPL